MLKTKLSEERWSDARYSHQLIFRVEKTDEEEDVKGH